MADATAKARKWAGMSMILFRLPAAPRPAAKTKRRSHRPPPTSKRRREFALHFIKSLMSWAIKPTPTVECRAAVSPKRGLTVFAFTLHGPPDYTAAMTEDGVDEAIAQMKALKIEADPLTGDLSVFDGLKIWMFRRHDEPWGKPSAFRTAQEVGSHIVMNKERRRTP